MSKIKSRIAQGFTLLELLITSSIIAMIALAVFSTFSMGIKVYNRIQYSGLTQADVLFSLEKLEKDLHNTLNFSGIAFVGENRKVSFAGLVGPQADSALGRVSYYLDTKNKSLVKDENIYPVSSEETYGVYSQGSPSSKTLASIKDIAFTYYHFDPQAREYVWGDSVNGTPLAVKIKVTFRGENDKDVEITRTVLIPAQR